MTQLNKEMIYYLTNLSKIECSEGEQNNLLEHLQKIVSYIELLNEINTDGISPCNHVLEDLSNVFREDEVKESLDRSLFLANAPSQIGGLIRVPPVIKNS